MASTSILIITVLVTLLAWNKPSLQQQAMLVPYRTFREQRWYQLVSSGFLHGDFMHLLFNMITFLFFGPVLEQVIGTPLFVILYLTAIVIANLPTLFKHRNNPQYASLGASGAVGAVLFAYILFFPLSNLYIMFIPIGIPAIIVGVLFVIYSYSESRKNRGNINHDAHFAGAVYGLIFTLVFVPESLQTFLKALGLIS